MEHYDSERWLNSMDQNKDTLIEFCFSAASAVRNFK